MDVAHQPPGRRTSEDAAPSPVMVKSFGWPGWFALFAIWLAALVLVSNF